MLNTKKTVRILLILIIFFCCALVCLAFLTPSNICRLRGGRPFPNPLSPIIYCEFKAKDAGKKCLYDKECEKNFCLYPDPNNKNFSIDLLKSGGVCSEYEEDFFWTPKCHRPDDGKDTNNTGKFRLTRPDNVNGVFCEEGTQ